MVEGVEGPAGKGMQSTSAASHPRGGGPLPTVNRATESSKRRCIDPHPECPLMGLVWFPLGEDTASFGQKYNSAFVTLGLSRIHYRMTSHHWHKVSFGTITK